MTTIAYDGKTLASDSRSTLSGPTIYEEDCQKLFTDVGPFVVLGIAGDFQDAVDAISLIEGYTQVDQIRNIDSDSIGDVALLGITKEGMLWSYAGDMSFQLREDKPFSTGSGSSYALAAMDLGLTAEEAVVYASTRDPFTNSIVQVAHLFPEGKTKKVKKPKKLKEEIK